MVAVKKYKETPDCPKNLIPEISVVGDHHLTFRCPEGCDQNTSIQFVRLEDIAEGEGVLTFNLRCPKCKKACHYKIYFGSHDCHTAHGLPWTEQVEYLRRGGI